MQHNRLFPAYLNKGSKGPAVFVLQMWLHGARFNNERLVPDGDYGDQTANAVSQLQNHLEIPEDGNFGPQTRKNVLRHYGIDFNAIMERSLQGKTEAVGP